MGQSDDRLVAIEQALRELQAEFRDLHIRIARIESRHGIGDAGVAPVTQSRETFDSPPMAQRLHAASSSGLRRLLGVLLLAASWMYQRLSMRLRRPAVVPASVR